MRTLVKQCPNKQLCVITRILTYVEILMLTQETWRLFPNKFDIRGSWLGNLYFCIPHFFVLILSILYMLAPFILDSFLFLPNFSIFFTTLGKFSVNRAHSSLFCIPPIKTLIWQHWTTMGLQCLFTHPIGRWFSKYWGTPDRQYLDWT